MTSLLLACSLVMLTALFALSWRGRAAVRSTSLQSVWGWTLIAELAWIAACIASLSLRNAALLDQIWYWTAILTLCPFISVLGAQRPASRVWNWFIIVPLMAVLGWPAMTVLGDFPSLPRLHLQSPVFLGFALVLIMGTGNYLGTRFTFPILMAPVAVCLVLLPYFPFARMDDGRAGLLRGIAALLIALGVAHGMRQARRQAVEQSRFDRLWFDFRDTFGIVWSIRIQDRINVMAQREKWLSRLGPEGFHWQPASADDDVLRTEERMEHALRWHLRRFVDGDWIDRRLLKSTEMN